MDQMQAHLAAVTDLLKQEVEDARRRRDTPNPATRAPLDPVRDGEMLSRRSIAAFREAIGA